MFKRILMFFIIAVMLWTITTPPSVEDGILAKAAAAGSTECEHAVMCSDPGVCILCGQGVTEDEIIYFFHESYVAKHDRNYHWQECGYCKEQTMPKLEHYTGCQEYAAGARTQCSFCLAENVKIPKKNQCIHDSFDELIQNDSGELLHVRFCLACQKIVTDGREPMPHEARMKCHDLGDGTHSCICSCGYRFGDEAHSGKYETVRKATLKKDGKRRRVCDVCGAVQKKTINRIGTVELSKTVYKYNGKQHKPKVKVTDAAGKTIPASQYTVIYPENSQEKGKHVVKIVFQDQYEGVVKKAFYVKSKGEV